MSNYQLKKYKVSLFSDSKKTQGLRTGDIVRRQCFDGQNVIYTLMVVTDYGQETVFNQEKQQDEQRNYFIGALLQGDPPQSGELLDFARITSLFDTDRSGALYLTASDEMAPYMDILDRLGMEKSLSWPSALGVSGFEDSSKQYVLKGGLSATYTERYLDRSRILTITRSQAVSGFEGIRQDFYEYVANPEIILISYWIKASEPFDYSLKLGYTEGEGVDGEWDLTADTEWKYVIKAAVVDHSGRLLRSVRLDLGGIADETVEVADFNVIRLSSVADFGSSPSSRIGRLDGVKDPVFGTLKGYGSYMQKVYATKSAHVSGTLTAGDEEGFASTFYAGRIHRNAFINSLEFNGCQGDAVRETYVAYDGTLEKWTEHIGEVKNPTGIGTVYRVTDKAGFTPQVSDWLQEHADEEFTLSFWLYVKEACTLRFFINNTYAEDWTIPEAEALYWRRVSKTFKIPSDALEFSLEKVGTCEDFFICSPQLEKGDEVTEYQPTDEKLDYSGGYGAWMARGGFGGTIQNPLLRLNYDGNGSIGTRNDSFELKQDGSGQLANHQIRWDEHGNVKFGDKVELTWENFDDDTKAVVNSSVRITGQDIIAVLTNPETDEMVYFPDTVRLTLEQTNLQSTPSQRQWYRLDGESWVALEGENGLLFDVDADADYWDDTSSVTFKCVVTLSATQVYQDTFTVKKFATEGFTIRVTSSNGNFFRNGSITTMLNAQVYYMGELLSQDFVEQSFVFEWHRYVMGEAGPVEQVDLGGAVGAHPNELMLDHIFDGTEKYVCEIKPQEGFDYYSLPTPFVGFNRVVSNTTGGGISAPNPDVIEYTICGPWEEGRKYYYRDLNPVTNRYEINSVNHIGYQWQCLKTGTTQEPSFSSTDWAVTIGDTSFRAEFVEPERICNIRDFDVTLTVRTWLGWTDITELLPDDAFVWERYSEDASGDQRETSDNIWKANRGNSGKQIHLTTADLNIDAGGVPKKVIFKVTAYLTDEISSVAYFSH